MQLACILNSQACCSHFRSPGAWDEKRKKLKYRDFMPRFIPWYCMQHDFRGFSYQDFRLHWTSPIHKIEIPQPQKLMNFFELLVLIWLIVTEAASYNICSQQHPSLERMNVLL
jgi:anaerobic ribonucleoside-triphosphate reductase